MFALLYVGIKVTQRCLNSKCRYGADGLEFDIDPQDGTADPADEMHKIAEMLKSRALVHRAATARAV